MCAVLSSSLAKDPELEPCITLTVPPGGHESGETVLADRLKGLNYFRGGSTMRSQCREGKSI